VYVAIKDNKLAVFLPFSNAHYINNWSSLVKESNPGLVKKMIDEQVWDYRKKRPKVPKEYKNLGSLSRWYANNCIFSGEKMRFDYGRKPLYFIQEGDKTLVPFRHFLQQVLDYRKASKKHPKKLNVEFFFNPRDFPVLRHDHKEPYDQIFGDQKIEREFQHKTYTPILSQSGNTEYHDIPIPTEDDMKRVSDNIYQEECKETNPGDETYETDWSRKKSVCVFRGSCTGCGITRETNMRLKAALLTQEFAKDKSLQNEEGQDVLDAKLTGWNRKPKMSDGTLGEIQPKEFKGLVVNKKNFMDRVEQSGHKFILNIDGHVKAFRLGNEMRYGSVILLVDSPYTLWFQKYMEPMKHYVPVKFDLSDLKSQLQWCLDKANDQTCQEIAQNALTFYETYLTKEKTLSHVSSLLEDMSHLRRAPRLKPNKQRMNVVVAYRESGNSYRRKQLKVFIQQMKAIFEPKTNLQIYIIEQESEREDYADLPTFLKQPGTQMAKFNLGRLKNIGFHIASQEQDSNAYYVLSDVDLLPSEGLIPSYLQYPKTPIHLGHLGTRYGATGEKPGREFLGGVISFGKEDFEKANGYPNNFWGWGGEDDCLIHRLKETKIKVSKPEEPVIDLEELTIKEKKTLLKQQDAIDMRYYEKRDADKTSWQENGLSNLEDSYAVLKTEDYEDYENVKHLVVKLKIMEQDKKEW